MKRKFNSILVKISLVLVGTLNCINVLNAQYTLSASDVVIEHGTIIECKTWATDWGTTEIIIPDTIDKQVITGVGESVFSRKKITKLKLSNEIEFIGAFSFYDNAIKELELPQKIKTVCIQAFADNQIKKLEFPKSIISIGRNAFSNNMVEEVFFRANSNLRYIGDDAFYFGDNETVWYELPTNSNNEFKGYYDTRDKKYKVGDKVRINPEEWTDFYADIPVRNISPEDVMIFGGEIYRCEVYPELILPNLIGEDTLTSIGQKAFRYHSGKSITINEGITKIASGAFCWANFESVVIPSTVKRIEEGAFEGTYLDTILMPNSITHVQARSFNGILANKVILSNCLEYIGEEAFNGNRFSEVILPNSLKYIGGSAFYSFPNVAHNVEIDSIILPNPIINEGFMFSNWENEFGETVEAMTDLKIAYEAQFIPTASYQVGGKVDLPDNIGVLLILSGDFEGVRNLNDDGTFEFPLNEGRTMNLAPYHEGYVFTPESVDIENLQADTGGFYFSTWIKDFDIYFTSNEFGTLEGETYQNRHYKEQTSAVAAIPNEGYFFMKWIDENGRFISSENPLVITVKQDMSITAIFDIPQKAEGVIEIDVQCYPNPTNDLITVEAQNAIDIVKLYDTEGKLVFIQQNINKTQFTFKLASFINGVGLISIQGDGFNHIKKVFVE